MHIPLGNFEFRSAKEAPEMVAEPVARALGELQNADAVGVCEIDPSLSDTANFCARYGITPDEAANCVVVEAKRGEERRMAACVILASTRADVNGTVCDVLGMKKASFAPTEKAVAETGMEPGAITPIGLPPSWPILIDARVAQAPYVIIGSGIRATKLAVPGSFLTSLPNARVIDGLAQPHVT